MRKFVMLTLCVLGMAYSLPAEEALSQTGLPPWINDAGPDNVLRGIGTAKLLTEANSAQPAELRARASIALQTGFDSLRRVHTPAPWGGTKGMYPESNTLREQHTPTACGGVVDSKSFNDPLIDELYLHFVNSVAMENAFDLAGLARTVNTWRAPDGTVWCAVDLNKAEVPRLKPVFEKRHEAAYKALMEAAANKDTGKTVP